MKYLSAIGGLFSLLILGLFMVYNGAGIYSSIWLSQWTDDPYLKDSSHVNTTKYKNLNYKYLGVYGGLGLVQGRNCGIIMLALSHVILIKMTT